MSRAGIRSDGRRQRRPPGRVPGIVIACLLALGAGACGASSPKHTVSSPKHTSVSTPAAPRTAATAPPSPPSVPSPLPGPAVFGSAGGVRAWLHGENHDPTINTLWHYSVAATDASGVPLSGTVDTEFVYGGMVVGRETPPTHQLTHGRLNDSITFPPASTGVSLELRVVVHTKLGTVTLDWPVKART
jgi:hypothetical protein